LIIRHRHRERIILSGKHYTIGHWKCHHIFALRTATNLG
jgi:hypothetical protein